MTDFRADHDLPYQSLVGTCDPETLPFKTTAELTPLTEVLGQERAIRSIDFALGMERSGYNLFAAGADGLGKSTIAEGLLRGRAASMAAPDDWVYVANFEDPDRPMAISFPAGQARRFASAVTVATRLAINNLREAFASDAYVRQRQDHAQQLQGKREAILTAIQARATALGFAVEFLPQGLMSTPIVDGQPVDDQAVAALPAERRTAIEQAGRELEDFVRESMLHIRALERESGARVAAIDANMSEQAIGNELDALIEHWGDEGKVAKFLQGARADLIAQRAFWLEPRQAGPWGAAEPELAAFRRYEVNVLIANDATKGGPVISENNPTHGNLLGRIEYFSQFGGMSTDHTMIRPGALLLANGGYLVLRVRDLLANPGAYEGLKRALARHAVAIENLSQVLSIMPTSGLRPEPIPIDLKVVLIGDGAMYSAMFRFDPDFRELFRVKADFDTEFDRTSTNVMGLASFVRTESATRAFTADAVARLVEHSSRLVDDQRKLSANMGTFGDVVHQAEFWAVREGATEVDARHVERALEESDYRSALVREHMQELIREGSLLIQTSGEAVGSVNGLSVIDLGDTSFGFPSRVTCVTGAGNGTITNVERESDLAGVCIHNKGFLTLRAFLLEQFGRQRAMAIQSSITFEQLYGEVDGDSASSTELYALLSSLSGFPISQSIAVTGSVNQRGDVQPIGGATTKIEGFYQVCCESGLDGFQGVMIPSLNMQSVVLRPEVAAAVREGRFHVWSVSRIEQGIEVLTGVPAGTRGEDGLYPSGSVFRAIEDRLDGLAHAIGHPAPTESSRLAPAPARAPELPGVPTAPPPAPPVQVVPGQPGPDAT